jgi:radical SAM protein with 4Fe4S-binding SPASM domain
MTNGTVSGLTNTIRETFEWVRVSLDTTDLVTYRRWKQSDLLPVVLANIERMYGGQAKVGVNVNVGPEHTPEMVEKLVNDVAEICDYIQFRPVLPRCWMTEGVEVNEEVWDLLRTLAAVESTISLSDDKLSDIVSGNTFPFRSCEAHHFEPILNANGDVCACMYHPKDKRFVFGNIYEERFQEIWNGPRRKAVAEEIRGIDYKKECQVCCKGTEVNKFLDYVAHPEEVEDRCFL